jgi:hypothetical protein
MISAGWRWELVDTSAKTEPSANDLHSSQKVRFQRFGLALLTYLFVIFALMLISRLGFGGLSPSEWIVFLTIAFIGNLIFFILFYFNINLRFSDPSLTREQIIYSSLWGMVSLFAMPDARPIILMFFLPAFSFGMLRLRLRQYLLVVLWVMGFYAILLVIEYAMDRPGFDIRYELFVFILFGILLTWFAFFGGLVSNIRRDLREQKKIIETSHEKIQKEIEERKKTQIEKEDLIIELKQALREVKALSGLLPICSVCKKIRDDGGYWNQIETYISDHSTAEFSHGICPDCAKKYYPEIYPDNE